MKISVALKLHYERMTDEEWEKWLKKNEEIRSREDTRRNIAIGQNERFKNMSVKEKERLRQANVNSHQDTGKNRESQIREDVQLKRVNSFKKTLNNKTEQEKELKREHYRLGTKKRMSNRTEKQKQDYKILQRIIQRELVAEGKHNWPKEKPVNNPTERIFDLFFAFIFLMNWNHNFKSKDSFIASQEFELDFVSWLLRFNVEANESYHKEENDKIRDKFIVDSGDLDFVHRYTTEYAITNMIDVVKTVYSYCNQQREKYKLFDLPILEFDTRWNLYCFQMQDLLKEWYSKKGNARFKIFRDKKREIDKQWLCLLEEASQKYSTNLAFVYREILEKNLKLNFRNVVSLWRLK
jgi:hypothetical protein